MRQQSNDCSTPALDQVRPSSGYEKPAQKKKIIWSTVQLALKTKKMPVSYWWSVLPEAFTFCTFFTVRCNQCDLS